MNPPVGSDIYVGLMSGTSLDGVDAVVMDFSTSPPHLLHSNTTPYADDLRQRIRALCIAEHTSLPQLYELDASLGEVYAGVVKHAVAAAGMTADQIQAVGCHGQTLYHSPDSDPAFTAQIGDPNRIAALTGLRVVADFRRMDIAYGGQGAPLAPTLHRCLFRDPAEDRVIINIGGIANITLLPANPDQPLLACDTGPGNTLSDLWIERHRQLGFDEGGAWARSGAIDSDLLTKLLDEEPYFHAALPKTTGTEYFNLAWLESRLNSAVAPPDVQATLIELTAITIARACQSLPTQPAKAYVCGGGAHNPYLLERLAGAMPDCRISTTAELGLDPDYVEATAFAWLARERILGRPVNLSEITGAERDLLLGGIYQPH